MINILIISLHYPPDNIIAARRSEAYANHFHKFGIFPTIITDRYEKEYDKNSGWTYKNHTKKDKPVIEDFETHKVIRLPRVVNTLQKFQFAIQKVPVLSSLFTFLLNLTGHFEMHMLGHYYKYRSFLTEHLRNSNYNMILAIDSPHYHVKLAAYLYKKFKIPFVCDFRDLYDNSILNKDYKPPFKIRLRNSLKKKYFRKWLGKSTFITAASKPWAKYYSSLSGRPGCEITNGYEPLENIYNRPNDKFIISHTGRLYQNQDWSIFSKGVRMFIERQKPDNFKVIFAGVRKDAENIIKYIKHDIPMEYIEALGWIERKQIEELQINTSVFFGSYLQGTKGHYPGKVFEYLGARKPVLYTPGDNGDVIDVLLNKTKAGNTANTPEEVCNFVTQKYNEWLQYGEVKYEGVEEEIIKYSRESQVKRMSEIIKSHVTKD